MKILLPFVAAAMALAMPETPAAAEAHPPIAGYDFGQKSLAKSPLTLADLESLKATMLFTDDDVSALRQSKPILADQTDAILDVWYGFVAATPQLVQFFSDPKTGKPDGAYLAAVRKRFAQWILDTADANYDQAWLDWQYEIALRHNKLKKNKTDGAASTAQINYRYIPALTIPVTTTLKPFLAKKGATQVDVDKMHAAWVKSVLLQTILWGQPYVRDGEF
ncbi:MAG: protoglobin domain-containing protein [Burkholderiales bacterium]